MIDKDGIISVQSLLIAWGRENYCSYPWRELDNPWLAILAEVLLQRTSASHVLRMWPDIVERFPSPETVLNATEDELLIFDSRFGLGRRARTVSEIAQFLDAYDYYPRDFEDLVGIYGVGHYTASAYLSLHMSVRAVLVDSNVARWLSRMTGHPRPVDVRRCHWSWELADKLTPSKNFKEYNYAVLDLSMTVCLPRTPKCGICPLKNLCDYPVRG